jgi:hypothetical protein
VNSGAAVDVARPVQFFAGAVPPAGLNFTYNHAPDYARSANNRLLDRAVMTPLLFGRFHGFGRKVD